MKRIIIVAAILQLFLFVILTIFLGSRKLSIVPLWAFYGIGTQNKKDISFNTAWSTVQSARLHVVDNDVWRNHVDEIYLFGMFTFYPDDVYVYYYRRQSDCYGIWIYTNRHIKHSNRSYYAVDCLLLDSLIEPNDNRQWIGEYGGL